MMLILVLNRLYGISISFELWKFHNIKAILHIFF